MTAVAEQVKGVPPAVRPIVRAAIEMVKGIAPRAEEISYQMAAPRNSRMVWKLVRYAVAGENVVGIGTLPGHSMVFFYRGRELDDGSGLLKGGGKDMRFIRLDSPADANRPEVKRMVRLAFRQSHHVS